MTIKMTRRVPGLVRPRRAIGHPILSCLLLGIAASAYGQTTPAATSGGGRTTQALKATLEQSREVHAGQLTNLLTTLKSQSAALAKAKSDKAAGEAALARYEKDETVIEAIGDVLLSLTGNKNQGTRARAVIEDANKRIRQLEPQIAGTKTALTGKTKEIEGYNRRMELEIVKSNPVTRAAEQARRNEAAAALNRDVETQKAQITAGEKQFTQQLAALDAAIEEAEEKGATEIVTKYQTDRRKITEAQEAWRASMESELVSHQKTQEQNFEKNRNEGIGATNSGMVRTSIRKATREAGGDAGEAVYFDQEAVGSTEKSAAQIAKGAPTNTEWKSIFDDVNWESSREFFQDLKEDELTWYEFSLRMGAYSKGVTRAGVDALKDLLVLIREAGDTGGEAFEAALEEHLGIKSDLFGSENTALLEKIATQGATLFDLDNPEGDKLAQQLVDLAGRVSTMAERAVEKRAQGDVKKTLEDFGYVVGTVAGVEEVAFAAAAKSARVLGGLWKATDTVEDAATATAKATEGARSATGGTKLDAPAAATPAKAPDYAASAGKLRGDDLTVTLETPPKIRDGAPDNPVIKIKRSDGQQLILREVVGEGSTTKVYKVEGREDIVVKLTRSEGAAGKLDDAGHAVVRKVDPDGSAIQVPERYQQHSINDPGGPYEGGKLEVVQKAPDDFKKATGTHAKGGGMTKGQKAAYRKGLEKLNENGFVFLDNKADNFAFKLKEGTTDEWVMVVVDPGSIVPMKNLDADAARKLQRAIDTPSDEALSMDRWHSDDHGEMTGRRVHQEWLASEFDHLIDWDAINGLAGTYYKTLGEGFSSQITRLKGEIFPFNPNNGAKFKDIAVSGKAPERPRTTGGDGEAPGGPKDGKPPPTQSVREAAAELTGKGPDYTGTKRVPGTRDHGGGDGGGSGEGNLISVGGSFDGVTPVPTIYIAFGPGSYEDYTGIATDCSPCQDFVDSYLALLETRPMTPGITAQLAAIKSALPACEAFRCPKSAWDGDDSGVHVELLRMNSVFGNSPFSGVDPLNVLEGTAQLIFVLNVNGQFVPTNRFNSSAGPESGCNANHYHLSNAISTPVISCSGQSVSDPDSSGCGFGKVDSAIGIPRSDCENR